MNKLLSILFFKHFQSGGWVRGDIDPEGSATGSHLLDGDHSQGWQTLPTQ